MNTRIPIVLLIVGVVFCSSLAVSAQSKRSGSIPGRAIVSISEALSGSSGAIVRWDVQSGDNVIGYNVYRRTSKGLQRVNPGMVPGSYVSTATPADSKFSFFDKSGTVGSDYLVEVVEVGTGKYLTDSAAAVFDARLNSSLHEGIGREPLNLKTVNVPQGHPFSGNGGSSLADFDTQQWVAAQPGAKIVVSEDGLFRVLRSELQTAGFDVNAPVENWQLYFQGVEQSIIVPGDGAYIEFFGKSLDTPEASQNAYYLVVGPALGKRMEDRKIRRIGPPVNSKRFVSSFVRKNRFLYVSTLRNGPEGNFFGEVISTTAASVNFDLDSFDSSSTAAELKVDLQGLSLALHQTKVVLNGVELGTVDGLNRDHSSKTFQISASNLLETGNTIEFTALLGGDFSLLDSIEVKYGREFVALNDNLAFETQNYAQTELKGFTSSSIRVFDLSRPDEPKRVVGLAPTAEGGGNFKVILPSYRRINMYAVADSSLLLPDSVEPIGPSTLGAPTNAANYLIITHPSFITEAQTWATYRTNDGYQTKVVDITDVLDEFSYGEVKGEAIRSFLNHAENNWQVDPDYVLLIGDGTYDLHDFEGNGSFDFLPILRSDTLYEETASDDAITDFNDDGLAEIAIGRIPARVASDVTDALAKVITFESSLTGAHLRGSLCASDFAQGYDFEALCDRVHNELPASIPLETINRGDVNAKAALIASMNTGKYIVNYSGHGASGIWASTSFFGNADVPSLANSNDLSLFTMLTCLNGYFIRPVNDSLSEALLKSTSGGAASVWSSSGSTTPDVQEVMAKRFFNQLGNGNMDRLGDLVNDAKATIVGGADVRRSWVLLGDPALRVKELSPAKNFKAGS